ncbi:hypothetical protein RJ641_009100 [Dillenia turbinata]|uniref:Uncharacterized protein n=1 Tax=Dillenia turbinata TaxID=194707 RepID=A0AAN8V1G5_9MAGN
MLGKAKIVLSGNSNSTSSMVAAIGYAWLLENKKEDGEVVVPVINLKRQKMWKQRQAAWLFHHVGLDANALLFSDEQWWIVVDLESLTMARQLVILVVGQDVLKTDGEVGSQCTILTDNYCEDAYNLLQTSVLKKLLVAVHLADRDGGAPMEYKVPDRKSTPISHHEAGTQNSDRNSHDAKSVKSSNGSQKSGKQTPSPAQAPTAAPAQAANNAPQSQMLPEVFLAVLKDLKNHINCKLANGWQLNERE